MIDEVATNLPRRPGDRVVDLDRRLVLPAPVEPHAHLDKALTSEAIAAQARDLPSAIATWRRYRSALTVAEIAGRAHRAALIYVTHGATAIRTHVDVGRGIALRAVEALAGVRSELSNIVDIQIVALATNPLTGAAGADNRALLRDAVVGPADVVGGAPWLDPDPAAALEYCLSLASDTAKPVDLHTDETLDPDARGLTDLIRAVEVGFAHRVAASHCVSLTARPEQVQATIAARVAASGIDVITLPQTNLYLQGRDHAHLTPRGLPPVRQLLAAGVTVAGGGDNMQDPFYPLGSGNPLDTAALLVLAAHLSPVEAYEMISSAARTVLGLPPVAVAPGFCAELLALRANTITDVLATGGEDPLVIHKGAIVAPDTSVTQHLASSVVSTE